MRSEGRDEANLKKWTRKKCSDKPNGKKKRQETLNATEGGRVEQKSILTESFDNKKFFLSSMGALDNQRLKPFSVFTPRGVCLPLGLGVFSSWGVVRLGVDVSLGRGVVAAPNSLFSLSARSMIFLAVSSIACPSRKISSIAWSPRSSCSSDFMVLSKSDIADIIEWFSGKTCKLLPTEETDDL